ncbi:hypothetical protein ACE4RV_15855 [Acetobacter persici]|uniref:hypothetical protein n=1 Tax=Acetobacter persici TaxID=1076596 RepID=UPI0036DD0E19
MLEITELATQVFDLAAKMGITYSQAYRIAEAINNGMSIASAISIISGIGSIVGVTTIIIRRKIFELGIKATATW